MYATIAEAHHVDADRTTIRQTGESLSWTVRWYLLPVDKDLSRSELLQRVSGIDD